MTDGYFSLFWPLIGTGRPMKYTGGTGSLPLVAAGLCNIHRLVSFSLQINVTSQTSILSIATIFIKAIRLTMSLSALNGSRKDWYRVPNSSMSWSVWERNFGPIDPYTSKPPFDYHQVVINTINSNGKFIEKSAFIHHLHDCRPPITHTLVHR